MYYIYLIHVVFILFVLYTVGRPHKPMLLILDEDQTYPSVRMIEIRTIPDRFGYVKLKHKKTKTIIDGQMEDNKEGGLFSCIARKRLMSKEHADIFRKSIMESGSFDGKGAFWMFNFPTTWVKYACGVCGSVHTLDIIFHTQE